MAGSARRGSLCVARGGTGAGQDVAQVLVGGRSIFGSGVEAIVWGVPQPVCRSVLAAPPPHNQRKRVASECVAPATAKPPYSSQARSRRPSPCAPGICSKPCKLQLRCNTGEEPLPARALTCYRRSPWTWQCAVRARRHGSSQCARLPGATTPTVQSTSNP
jgi:hypothetical protein